jgi:hypothetical protein
VLPKLELSAPLSVMPSRDMLGFMSHPSWPSKRLVDTLIGWTE